MEGGLRRDKNPNKNPNIEKHNFNVLSKETKEYSIFVYRKTYTEE